MTTAAPRFRLLERLAATRLYDLHRAWDDTEGVAVWAKVLHATATADDEAKRRFEREFVAAERVRHPSVCRYLGLLAVEDRLAIVTEEPLGRTLRAHLAMGQDHQLPLERVAAIAQQVADGLLTCHRSGIVHRDVRPENVFLSDDGAVKIANFGLALVQDLTALTATGMLIGSPDYVPPESLLEGSQDLRVDIYAYGVMLWELIAGKNPFAGKAIQQILVEKQARCLPPISSVVSNVDRRLERVIELATQPDPRDRPCSFSEVLVILSSLTPLVRKARAAEARCLACGNGLISLVPFCTRCGTDRVPSGNTLCAIRVDRSGDAKQLARVLSDHLRFVSKSDVSVAKLDRTPYAVGTDLTRAEADWLSRRLAETGAVVTVVDRDALSYPLSTMFIVLAAASIVLPICIVLGATASVANFSIAAVMGVLAATGAVYLASCHFEPPWRIPGAWWRGLRQLCTSYASAFKTIGGTCAALLIVCALFTMVALMAVTLSGAQIQPEAAGTAASMGLVIVILYVALRGFMPQFAFRFIGRRHTVTHDRLRPIDTEVRVQLRKALQDVGEEGYRDLCDRVMRDYEVYLHAHASYTHLLGPELASMDTEVKSAVLRIVLAHEYMASLESAARVNDSPKPDQGLVERQGVVLEHSAGAAAIEYQRRLNTLQLLAGAVRAATLSLVAIGGTSTGTADIDAALRILRAEVSALGGIT